MVETGFQRLPSLPRRVFKVGDRVPVNGIYRVEHAAHRLPHEVTLLGGQPFPPCAKCRGRVRFELVHGTAGKVTERRSSVVLYQLPVLENGVAKG